MALNSGRGIGRVDPSDNSRCQRRRWELDLWLDVSGCMYGSINRGKIGENLPVRADNKPATQLRRGARDYLSRTMAGSSCWRMKARGRLPDLRRIEIDCTTLSDRETIEYYTSRLVADSYKIG